MYIERLNYVHAAGTQSNIFLAPSRGFNTLKFYAVDFTRAAMNSLKTITVLCQNVKVTQWKKLLKQKIEAVFIARKQVVSKVIREQQNND